MGEQRLAMAGRALLCMLLLAASVQLCLSSTTEDALVVTDFIEPAEPGQAAKSKGEPPSLTTTDILLEKMFKTIPYKAQCGPLAEDATNIASSQKMSFGACAVHCTSEFKCKSFEYDHAKGHCSISPRQLLKKTSAGEALACPTKNVFITSSMQLPSKPDVFTKRESQVAEQVQEVQKEAKVDAEVMVQEAKAQTGKQLATLTKRVATEDIQKMDVEAKEKAEAANAVKEIHQAEKLKTQITSQATVRKVAAEQKKQLHQKLTASKQEVKHLRGELAESQEKLSQSQTQLEKDKVAVEKDKVPAKKDKAPAEKEQASAEKEQAPAEKDEASVEKHKGTAEKKDEPAGAKPGTSSSSSVSNETKPAPGSSVQDSASRWKIQNTASKLEEVQGKIKKLKAKTVVLSQGALACEARSHKLEETLTKLDPAAVKKKLANLQVNLKKMIKASQTSTARRAELASKNGQIKSQNNLLEEEIERNKELSIGLSKALYMARDSAIQHKDKMDSLREQLQGANKETTKLRKKSKLLGICNKNAQADLEKCNQETAKQLDLLDKKLNKKTAAFKVAGSAFTLCKKELDAAKSQATENRGNLAKAETVVADLKAKYQESLVSMKTKVHQDVSATVKQESRRDCDLKLGRAIQRVAQKHPISEKCQVCAKLEPKDQAALDADCTSCESDL